MAAGIHLPGSNETIDLQQQVARLQALLEASRQVHSTIREEAVLGAVLRIVVRELEMAGAAFPGTGLSYGEVPDPAEQTEDGPALLLYLLQDREGALRLLVGGLEADRFGELRGGQLGTARLEVVDAEVESGVAACGVDLH